MEMASAEDAGEFSPACMKVLHALCDTLIPSLPYSSSSSKAQAEKHLQIAAFFQMRGSQDGLPSEVAQKMRRFLRPADLAAVKFLLWLLSTRAGTLLLARKLSFTCAGFPLARAFPALPLPKREKLLQAWASSPGLFRTVFTVFKAYILREFYTKLDKDGRNPIVWNALDYVGPDPSLTSLASDACDNDLEMSIVHMSKDVNAVLARLKEVGVLSQNGTLNNEVKISADAVIIGSGSGGSVVASQLAEAGYRVIVLEKGKYFRRTDLSLLEGYAASMYEGEASLSTSDGGIFIFAGSTLGGGSAVNWSASFKTPPHVLREWSLHDGLGLFASPRYVDAMDKVCKRLQVHEELAEQENLSNSALRKGCIALGMHVGNVPRNAPSDHFCGWCGFGCKSGKKNSANRAWLVDAARKGAVMLTGCEARKIVLTQQKGSTKPMRARGVLAEACIGNTKIAVRVDARVVVAACGALWTPPLLRRSGLRNYHIGRNLHLHPVMFTWGYFKEVEAQLGRSYEGGIMTAFSREAANWDDSGYGAVLMTPSIHPGMFAAFMPWINGKTGKETMLGFANTATLIAITRDSGSGCVSEDDTGRLRIDYKLAKTDRARGLAAVCNALRILVAAGAAKVGTNSMEGSVFECEKRTGAELAAFLGGVQLKCFQNSNTPIGSAHQMGSCRMGTSSTTSAVDPNGETWEAQGLFVADTSVFPTAVGINPMVTVQSIAFCTSQSIIRFLQNSKTVTC